LDEQTQAVQGDPLNFVSRFALALSLFILDRVEDAQREARRVLEFEENHAWASTLLALTYARQQMWKEALYYAEKASPRISWVSGALTGILKRMGEEKRAEELIQKLPESDSTMLATYYYLCGDIEKAADWMKKVIEDRYPAAANLALAYVGSSPRWPELAKLMNLPVEAGLQAKDNA
jgi:tetratricopeptide (TPR) repeat protein